ncbi:L-aspartate oxidase [Bacillus pakistanensis]|uniref:L-aspartate oxidase n=1 Tax=Rossellomorea pakistanensis TaxID=992288 RepID=A0ABS2NAE6_9BACI|nr:L-aspartate oxidase [Bacillus pakistanensis]MBM7584826.1 L-aspartate oxidase [Bacillus pakistanensis]
MKKADVIIVGSGIAALQLARTLSQQLHVMIITKNHRRSSNSYMAQGGIAAAISKEDHSDQHFIDTMIAGEWHGNDERVKRLVEEGKEAVEELIALKAPFDRNGNDEFSLGMEGAHSTHRILHSGGDQTGKHLINFLLETLSTPNVEWIENEMAIELLLNSSGSCIGVKTKNGAEETREYFSSHIVLATGGAGGLYLPTTNHSSVSGDGLAMAYRAGVRITDLEFFQFHPTLLTINGKAIGLISEAVRGAGATLINDLGDRIMEGKHPQLELGPRHIVAHEIFIQNESGRKVFLDISSIDHFQSKFPSISSMCVQNGICLEDGKIPVSPGSHFMMGGIVIDEVGRTNLKGLYAIGEVACSGVHGANRLASNSLLEGLVYGKRLASFLIKHLKIEDCKEFSPIKVCKKSKVPLPFSMKEIQENMMRYVGIIREKKGLDAQDLWLKSTSMSPFENIEDWDRKSIQTYFMWINALLMTKSASLRTESRGGHIRSDFPQVDDSNWFKKRIVHEQRNQRMKVEYDEQREIKIYA